MSINRVGSNVNLLFQSRSVTFTPDQFTRVIQEKGFMATQGVASVSLNPNAPPVQTVYFSKDNLMVLYNPSEYLVMFQIINTLNFAEMYQNDILPILKSLNFVHEIINVMGLECNTKIITDKSTIKSLTLLLNKDFLNEVSGELGIENLAVFTIRMSSQRQQEKTENMTVIIEPLVTDPEHSYHFSIIYRTIDNSKFDAFINRFGEDMILKIIRASDKCG